MPSFDTKVPGRQASATHEAERTRHAAEGDPADRGGERGEGQSLAEEPDCFERRRGERGQPTAEPDTDHALDFHGEVMVNDQTGDHAEHEAADDVHGDRAEGGGAAAPVAVPRRRGCTGRPRRGSATERDQRRQLRVGSRRAPRLPTWWARAIPRPVATAPPSKAEREVAEPEQRVTVRDEQVRR